jgi:hypothetical protein
VPVASADGGPSRHEVVEKRTAVSRTYSNGDGTYDLEMHVGAINYFDKKSRRYEPIDSTLREVSGDDGPGWENVANSFRVMLPKKLGKGWASVEQDGVSVRFRPTNRVVAGGAQSADVSGAILPMASKRVSYARGFQGADIEYLSWDGGLKETISLPAYPGTNRFGFELVADGAFPRLNDVGGIDFCSTDATAPIFTIAPPYMVDSSRDPQGEPALSRSVRYEISPHGSGWILDIVADDEWLKDSARVYPVRIDPSITHTYTGGWDTYVRDTDPNGNYDGVIDAEVVDDK